MYQNILFPLDLSEDDRSWQWALPVAIEYAQRFQANLHVLTVVPDFGMSLVSGFFPEEFEQKALNAAQEHLHHFVKKHIPENIQVQHIVGHGTVYKEILHAADEIKADLIIMSSHRPELKDYLLGPNAARVVRHSKVSVLVVREPKL